MKICDKILMDRSALMKNGPINIVAFGDSVTHGAVGKDEINYETVYWNRLRQKINAVRNYVPVNVINAGIGGDVAKSALSRMDSQVFIHNPDLVIICFGLNDVNRPLDDYINPLKSMFEKCTEHKTDAVFMTPNMLNTSVDENDPLIPPMHVEYAHKTADIQNSGRMDKYIQAAVNLANSMGITVCDCYSKWKELSKKQDTTLLLANRINHPIKEMHELFAQSLFECIFKDSPVLAKSNDSTMWKNN